jgi:hypothetical protein
MTMHVFATILALYPFTKTEEIADEFGLSVVKVRKMARVCRVSKNKYLLQAKKNGIQLKKHSKK